MGVLNLEEERKLLAICSQNKDHLFVAGYGVKQSLQSAQDAWFERQQKLVTALEQLEQAREAHRNMTRYASERMLAHLDEREGDVYHEMQALKVRFGYKQQEVGK